MNFLPVAIIYYYYKTNDVLNPKFYINYSYSNYFIFKSIFHIIRLRARSKLIN